MLTLLISQISTNAYEGRIRTRMGRSPNGLPGPEPNDGMLSDTPVLTGSSEKDIVEAAKPHLKPSLVRRHRGIRIEVREAYAE